MATKTLALKDSIVQFFYVSLCHIHPRSVGVVTVIHLSTLKYRPVSWVSNQREVGNIWLK